jgi:MOSC domain-containing protein YiiM
MAQDAYPGWSRLYARVLVEGTVHPGDQVSWHHTNRGQGME